MQLSMQLDELEPTTPPPTWQIVFTNPRMQTSAIVATFAIKKLADVCYSGIASLDPDNRTLYALRKVK